MGTIFDEISEADRKLLWALATVGTIALDEAKSLIARGLVGRRGKTLFLTPEGLAACVEEVP